MHFEDRYLQMCSVLISHVPCQSLINPIPDTVLRPYRPRVI